MGERRFSAKIAYAAVKEALDNYEKAKETYLSNRYNEFCNYNMRKINNKRKYWFFGPYRTVTPEELLEAYTKEDEWGNSPENEHSWMFRQTEQHQLTMKIKHLLPLSKLESAVDDTVLLNDNEAHILQYYLERAIENGRKERVGSN